MKGRAYKAALKRVGLSVRAAGPFLGFTARHSFRIAAGEADLPEAARKLLALIAWQGWSAGQFDAWFSLQQGAPKKT